MSAAVETAADGDQILVLKPSEQFLYDPDVTYPVVVAPTNTPAGPTTDTWIQYDAYPSSQRRSTELKAGTYDGVQKARSFLKYDVAKYAGKKIVDTDLRLYSCYSSTCSTSGAGVQVRRHLGLGPLGDQLVGTAVDDDCGRGNLHRGQGLQLHLPLSCGFKLAQAQYSPTRAAHGCCFARQAGPEGASRPRGTRSHPWSARVP
ncbi:DNRLRE domain-containing protein [Streptomyces sp. enrichment culture]|uniref:DNRLRE domain-containing protein n=1 Tax=Streptomyces sp. enrichment culture TaxID=1795815 RepID=UPI003F5637AD